MTKQNNADVIHTSNGRKRFYVFPKKLERLHLHWRVNGEVRPKKRDEIDQLFLEYLLLMLLGTENAQTRLHSTVNVNN